jgi:hypothetical protein
MGKVGREMVLTKFDEQIIVEKYVNGLNEL